MQEETTLSRTFEKQTSALSHLQIASIWRKAPKDPRQFRARLRAVKASSKRTQAGQRQLATHGALESIPFPCCQPQQNQKCEFRGNKEGVR